MMPGLPKLLSPKNVRRPAAALLLGAFILITAPSVAPAQDVHVYGTGLISESAVSVDLFADITTSLVSYGVKLRYQPSQLVVTDARIDEEPWYIGEGAVRFPTLPPKTSFAGEIVFLGGFFDPALPVGRIGNGIPLGHATFSRNGTSVSPLNLTWGKAGTYVDFATSSIQNLDILTGAVTFGGIVTLEPAVELRSPAHSVDEGDGDISVTAVLPQALPSDVTVPLLLSGTASEGPDFILPAPEILILAGNTTGSTTLTLVEDTVDEPDETVVLTMGMPVGAPAGLVTTHTLTIRDNDYPLRMGLNLFGYPVEAPPGMMAADLYTALGGPALVEAIHRYDPASGVFETWDATGGTPFSISNAEGYLVYMRQDAVISFPGSRSVPTLQLVPGLNLVTVPTATDGNVSDEILAYFGSASQAASIQRFDRERGVFDTLTQPGGTFVGPQFPIQRGEAYFVHMLQGRTLPAPSIP